MTILPTMKSTMHVARSIVLVLALLSLEGCSGLASSVRTTTAKAHHPENNNKWLTKLKPKKPTWARDFADGYRQRVAADPDFAMKSLTEIVVAGSTQVMAEWERRGGDRMLPEFDFVFAGVLTAVYGKYASMWKVSKTASTSSTPADDASSAEKTVDSKASEKAKSKSTIPTNAFQPYLLDGVTRPTIVQRLQSLALPFGPLFRAGVWASLAGYGFTALMIALRSWLVPSYIPVTKTVNIIYASLYTGVYMATSSNLRYQILQGVIEPLIDKYLRKIPVLHAAAILSARTANGLIGSVMAISGMRMLGLQKLR